MSTVSNSNGNVKTIIDATKEKLGKHPEENTKVKDIGFGQWTENYMPNVVYPAVNDCFISAFSSGNTPATEIYLYSGVNLNQLKLRTRISCTYSGIVCPVPKNHYWLVKPENNPNSVSIIKLNI